MIYTTFIILATSYGSKLCFIINLYFYITFVYNFMPFCMNDGTAQVTLFSSTLPFRLEILSMDYFVTPVYLMMLLQNNPLVPTREFFTQSTPGM